MITRSNRPRISPPRSKLGGNKFMLLHAVWFSIDTRLPQYHSFKTCYEDWAKTKKMHSDDVNHQYNIVSNLMAIKKQHHGDLSE